MEYNTIMEKLRAYPCCQRYYGMPFLMFFQQEESAAYKIVEKCIFTYG